MGASTSCKNQAYVDRRCFEKRPAWSRRRVSVLIVCADEGVDLIATCRGE